MYDEKSEDEVRAEVQKIIDENKLDASIVGIDSFDFHPVVTVEVARSDFGRAQKLYICPSDFGIFWEQRQPPLVGADVGDLVLIYNKNSDFDNEVGFVSAKYTREDGTVYYGCRYLLVKLGDHYMNGLYDFKFSKEDYGGYKEGFIRVLDQQEAIDFLQKQLDLALKEEQERIQKLYKRSSENLKSVISCLNDCERVNGEIITSVNMEDLGLCVLEFPR